MKKNRPGATLTEIVPLKALAKVEDILFRETGTFGVRRYPVEREKLLRREAQVETPWGRVRGKLGWREGATPVFTPEYDDCARVARERGVALAEVFRVAQQSYKNQ